jgi:GTP-binding protein
MMNVFEVSVMLGARYAVADGANRPPGSHREQPRTAHRTLYFLDLPGYGYSRASKSDRLAFRRLLIHVVERPRLAGVVWLLDMRRDPSPDDLSMQDVFSGAGTRVLAALTKADKLPRGQRIARTAALTEALGIDTDQVIATSARTGDGLPDLRDAVAALGRAGAG